ncbi:unnamed protein product [Cylicostephanus goldi]|uniref:C2H2-type domain-containing protein n=1 Tax=Cylicostephanus goldi TaxID=71465 RepID=A0A3P7N9M2_CYLGO|nr:unnamed protein product [Cylicostephanus goldi]
MKPQAAKFFNCDKCDAKFTRADALRRHGRKKHMETYAYRITCSVCDAEVANHRQLAAHAQLEHAIEEDDYSVHKITFNNVNDYKVEEFQFLF